MRFLPVIDGQEWEIITALADFPFNPNDPMLVGARDLYLKGEPSSIFDIPELRIIRQKYYSGHSPTDTGGVGSP
jgi:hypothetical protein